MNRVFIRFIHSYGYFIHLEEYNLTFKWNFSTFVYVNMADEKAFNHSNIK